MVSDAQLDRFVIEVPDRVNVSGLRRHLLQHPVHLLVVRFVLFLIVRMETRTEMGNVKGEMRA